MLFKDLCCDRHETPDDNYKRISVDKLWEWGNLSAAGCYLDATPNSLHKLTRK